MESPLEGRENGAGCLSLPMYDLPELSWAHDALADALLVRLARTKAFMPGTLPTRRERPGNLLGCWRNPMLLLSQTCGYPLVTTLDAQVRVVATPCYSAPGCSGAWMRSALVVREEDPAENLAALRGRATAAINGHDSNSGMNLLRAAAAPFAREGVFFRRVVTTGAHVESLRAVASGAADIAAIDCVTWALLQRVRPDSAAGLRRLEWTQPTPGLPLVTSKAMSDNGIEALREVLDDVLLDPALQPIRDALLIAGFERLERSVYARVSELEQEAAGLSYPVLR